jgi:hypothetical protein
MSSLNRWQSGTAAFLALTSIAGASAPIVMMMPAQAQTTSFSDVSSSYWAASFISELSQRDIIAGFPDGTFRPDEPVTRAQFAAMIRKAFNRSQERSAINFVDVPSSYWASSAIQEAYTTGFLAGYPGNVFRPNQNIPRVQVLVSLANGLDYSVSTEVETILQQYYSDAAEVPSYARSSVAAATDKQIVVNYPNIRLLNPNEVATRAEVAAFIYQALVSSGQATAITSPYVVGQRPPVQTPTQVRIPSGTTIPVKYDQAEKILVTPDETAPLTLTVAQNITTSQGTVLIPSGSQVVGELRPAEGGSQFVAQELVLTSGQRIQLNANSEVITTTEEVRKGASAGTIVKDAALGAAAAAAVSAVTGDRAIATEEVLGGAGIGGLLGLFLGRDRVTLIRVDPDQDLNLTLNSDLVLPTGSSNQ